MKPLDPKQTEFDEVEIIAAEWFSRREFGLTPQESEELVRWLNADFRHAQVFAELDQTSSLLDRWPETLAASSNQRPSAKRFEQLADLHRWIWATALATSIALIGVVAWRARLSRPVPYAFAAVTEVGEFRVLSLPDGSLIRLNTDSAVDVGYSKHERHVRLTRGEALFTVAKNPARPFYAEAGGVSVRAVGTAFDVRLQNQSVAVLVTEGKVRVEDSAKGVSILPAVSGANQPPVLEAGQEAVVDIRPEVKWAHFSRMVTVPARAIAQILAWREKRLEFGSVPLSEVVAEFNRYNAHKLVIADPELAAQQFGGTFRVDGYETLLNLLEQNFDVVLDRHANETILRRRGH